VWVAVPRAFRSGVEIVFEDARFTAVACQQYDERLADVAELHVLLNTDPVVSYRLRARQCGGSRDGPWC